MIQSVKRKKRNILRAASYLNLQEVNYTVSDLEVIDFLETTFTVLLNLAQILFSLSDSTLK